MGIISMRRSPSPSWRHLHAARSGISSACLTPCWAPAPLDTFSLEDWNDPASYLAYRDRTSRRSLVSAGFQATAISQSAFAKRLRKRLPRCARPGPILESTLVFSSAFVRYKSSILPCCFGDLLHPWHGNCEVVFATQRYGAIKTCAVHISSPDRRARLRHTKRDCSCERSFSNSIDTRPQWQLAKGSRSQSAAGARLRRRARLSHC